VREAEQHAQQDAEARQAAEDRNAADTLAYSTEKTLRDAGDRLSESDKQSVEGALSELREALKGNDVDRIRSAREHLEQVWQPVAASLYSQAQSGAQQEPTGAAYGGSSSDTSGHTGGDDVVDAEFRSSDES
jgi:molecular chaperone DnaK